MKQTKGTRRLILGALIVSAMVLASCGGGGGGSDTPAPTNSIPVARAGVPQNVVTGATVTLDGSSSSDADGDALTYSWLMVTRPVGSTATLSASNVVRPSFTADIAGIYVAQLSVSDGRATSALSTVTVTAATLNVAPVAVTGADQSVVAGASVQLDGTGSSDANGDALSFSWTLSAKPTGSAAVLASSNAARASMVVDVPGIYVATLVVSDGSLQSPPATTTVTAAAANAAPVANAGPAQQVITGTLVTLNGAGSSDANGDALTYSWAMTSRPTGSSAVLSGASSTSPTFTADVAGDYVASLVVSDGQLSSAPATTTVTATLANAAPVAAASGPQELVAGARVTLDGSGSTDANGDALTYAWTLTAKPSGSTAALTNPNSVSPTFTADLPGVYVGSLVVSDGRASSSPVQVSVSATAVAVDSLVGTWDASTTGKTFFNDSGTVTVTKTANTVTFEVKKFFDGTCLYTAEVTPAGNGLSPISYQCSDFSQGVWSLLEARRQDVTDLWLRIQIPGSAVDRIYGMSSAFSDVNYPRSGPVSSFAGLYSGIATGGPFGTQGALNISVTLTGTSFTLSIKEFFDDRTCQYSATVAEDGWTLSNLTYRCSNFTSGAWALLDLRKLGGQDLYVSLKADGVAKRTFGVRDPDSPPNQPLKIRAR